MGRTRAWASNDGEAPETARQDAVRQLRQRTRIKNWAKGGGLNMSTRAEGLCRAQKVRGGVL